MQRIRKVLEARAAAPVLLVITIAVTVILGVFAPDLVEAQRATGRTFAGIVLNADPLLDLQIALDGVFIAAWVAFGSAVFLRFKTAPTSDSALPDSARAGIWLVCLAAMADVVEDLLLFAANHLDDHQARLLGAMRAAGIVKWAFLLAAVIALAMTVTGRRGAAGITKGDPNARPPDVGKKWDPPRPSSKQGERLGICLSGGGIRSAAFSLGAMQALQDNGKLAAADYLAAASGGAYLASGWAVSNAQQDATGPNGPWSRGSTEERWFRDHSSYLVPDFRGGAAGLGRLLGGVVVNVALIWLLLFFVARPVGWAMFAAHDELRAVKPIAISRDSEARIAPDETETPVDLPQARKALRYGVGVRSDDADGDDEDAVAASDGETNRVCFDTPPFDPSGRDQCFSVEQDPAGLAVVEVRDGTLAIVRQPKVRLVKPEFCEARPDDPRCVLVSRLSVVGKPQLKVADDTFVGVEQIASQLEVAAQPRVAPKKSGLVGRPTVSYDWWMWEGTVALAATATALLFASMLLRLRGARARVTRSMAGALAGAALVWGAVTIALPWLVAWLPLNLAKWAGGGKSAVGSGLSDYLLPGGGFIAIVIAATRGFLSGNRTSTTPSDAAEESTTGIPVISRVWRWLKGGEVQLGWYESSPLKVVLAIVMVVVPITLFVLQLQYASANGVLGRLMGVAFVHDHLPYWMWWPEYVKFGVVTGILVALGWRADTSAWSLYPFYKQRLSSAFILRRNAAGVAEPLTYVGLVPFSELEATAGPELIVCCAVNLSTYGDVPPGRRSASFTFSRDWVGGPVVGYISAADYWNNLPDSRCRDLTVPSAMAISGAASRRPWASSTWGRSAACWRWRISGSVCGFRTHSWSALLRRPPRPTGWSAHGGGVSGGRGSGCRDPTGRGSFGARSATNTDSTRPTSM